MTIKHADAGLWVVFVGVIAAALAEHFVGLRAGAGLP